MAHILVTGGVGFIGYHVTRALLMRGDNVVVVDDYSNSPYPAAFKRRNARDLMAAAHHSPSATDGQERLRLVEASVTDREAIAPLADGATAILHLAGLAGVRPSFATPALYARVNVEGTAIVQEVARERAIDTFVFASSSSVYGNATPLPAREDAPAVAPESPYAASKRSAELVASALCRSTPAMRCVALRFFTVYGPRQRPEMAITQFVRALLARRPLVLFGDGTMRRDFTHVDDIVRGVLLALERGPQGFRAYNLGSGAPIELLSLVDALSELTGCPAVVQRAAVPLGDVEATFADVARARTELGWEPRISLRDGLESVIAWARANPE
ncbi:MAG: NAD-dependent epimerase/dehydratase family protein [Polyangiaceae bacterium]